MRVVETITEVEQVAKFLFPEIQIYGLKESLEAFFKKEIETIGSTTLNELIKNPFEFQKFFWINYEKETIEINLRTIHVKLKSEFENENEYLYFYSIK